MTDQSSELQTAIQSAYQSKQAVFIQGNQSKRFYAYPTIDPPLRVNQHHGVIRYEPSELVVKVRGGTSLATLEALLNQQQQMLAFEPPSFNADATIGGTIACGFSGPARPYYGSVRDYVLGMTVLTGKAEILNFGGQVMKNVAGYDVSRLMTGAMGTLGIILDVSCKVLPKPEAEMNRHYQLPLKKAMDKMHQLAAQDLPISGMCYIEAENCLKVRLSSYQSVLDQLSSQLGGDKTDELDFWQQLKQHQLPFFQTQQPLWRISIASNTPPLKLSGNSLIDWGGAQRWLVSEQADTDIRQHVEQYGGHATLFRHAPKESIIFHPLPKALQKYHQRLKQTFDPHHILNRFIYSKDW